MELWNFGNPRREASRHRFFFILLLCCINKCTHCCSTFSLGSPSPLRRSALRRISFFLAHTSSTKVRHSTVESLLQNTRRTQAPPKEGCESGTIKCSVRRSLAGGRGSHLPGGNNIAHLFFFLKSTPKASGRTSALLGDCSNSGSFSVKCIYTSVGFPLSGSLANNSSFYVAFVKGALSKFVVLSSFLFQSAERGARVAESSRVRRGRHELLDNNGRHL